MKATLSHNDETEVGLFAQPKARQSLSTFISFVFALVAVCGLFYSYLYLRSKHAAQIPVAPGAATNSKQATLTAATPQAQIAQDETWAKNGQAIIGGTVRNVSRNKLNNLLVELELKRRADGQTENLNVDVMPRNLEPEDQGKFSLRVPSREYSGLRIVSLKDKADSINIAFTSVPGAPRPVEPAPQAKVIIVQRPAPRTRGDEFLNTPDNPEVIR